MAVIYLSHPKHGVKVATMELEAQHDEMHGWMRFDPDEPLPDDTEPVNVMPRRPRRPRQEASE